jgi:anti-sigma regulatory factor (Ser/Thr protein kinase)
MNLFTMLGVISGDDEIDGKIQNALLGNVADEVRFFYQQKEIFDYLDFSLPEIVIINFSDPTINVSRVMSHIQSDRWLMGFCVVGLFSSEKNTEEELMNDYASCNLLTILEFSQIASHLAKTVRIIKENYQLIFQQYFSGAFTESIGGSFLIDNDIQSVSLYAGIMATILLQHGLMSSKNKVRLQIALEELIVNGIEHGNCGITYNEKTNALENGISVAELVALRCKDEKIANKKVHINWEIKADLSIFTIIDEGDGFDVEKVQSKIAQQDAYSRHGRGIALAMNMLNSIRYTKKGNAVQITVQNDTKIEHEIPEGFLNEKIFIVKSGDLIIKEGAPGDSICYIVSGRYGVYQKTKQIASLGPDDIFIGEMAFLLGQKRSASVIAETDGKLIVLSRKALISVIKNFPQYGIFLAKLLAQRLDRQNKRLSHALPQI